MRLHASLVLGISLLFAMAASLTAAGDAKDEAIQKDRKKYEGTWQVVSLETDGNKADEEDAKKITVVNEADGKWAIEVEGNIIARGTSKIDPTTKPKAVDLTVMEGENSGQTALGIYEFGDDTRKVCLAEAGKERPTEFAAPAGSGDILAFAACDRRPFSSSVALSCRCQTGNAASEHRSSRRRSLAWPCTGRPAG